MTIIRLLFLTFTLVAALPPCVGFSLDAKTSFASAKEKALAWLESRMVPNDTVPDPQPERMHLVLSYAIPTDDPSYKYLYGRSMVYDNALAVIAFTMAGDYSNAEFVLNTLKRLVSKDGSLWFGYNVNNSWPSVDDHSGALVRTGSSAWVGYAAVFYILHRQKEEPDFLDRSKTGQAFLKMARAIADNILRLQVKNPKDLRFGLVTGGKNSSSLAYVEGSVVEDFREETVDWVSTEHNIDAYIFLADLARVTGEKTFTIAAGEIQKGIFNIWSAGDNQFYQGIKPDQIDKVLALDCASWGSIFSFISGKTDFANACITAVEKNYKSIDYAKGIGEIKGFKPYAVKEIFEDTNKVKAIAKYYFPGKPDISWKEMPGVWGEGSLGVAVAYAKLGQIAKAKEVVNNILRMQTPEGGVLYFTRDIPHEFASFPSVASTAWLVMALSVLENKTLLEEFWRE
jgi:hypothetical protein